MKEIWKEINEYPNYMVSNMGRVKSLNYNHTGREKILKQRLFNRGYLYVGLWKNGKQKYFSVHRLEYEAFYGEIPKGMQVNHINEIKTDNRLENLNLMTPKENINWGTAIQRRAEKKTNGKGSKPVLQIDQLTDTIIAEFPSIKEVQRQLGLNQPNISRCCNGKQKTCGGYKWKFKLPLS